MWYYGDFLDMGRHVIIDKKIKLTMIFLFLQITGISNSLLFLDVNCLLSPHFLSMSTACNFCAADHCGHLCSQDRLSYIWPTRSDVLIATWKSFCNFLNLCVNFVTETWSVKMPVFYRTIQTISLQKDRPSSRQNQIIFSI